MKYLWKGIMAVVLTVCIVNCQNEDYLQDGGKHNPYYNGTVLEYLNQHPDKHYFSELTDLIHYAGLDSVLQNEEITFFAPTDFSIEKSMDYLNEQLYWRRGEDSIKDLHQIQPEVWKEYLSMYIIPGNRQRRFLADSRQILPERHSSVGYRCRIRLSGRSLLLYGQGADEHGCGVL